MQFAVTTGDSRFASVFNVEWLQYLVEEPAVGAISDVQLANHCV